VCVCVCARARACVCVRVRVHVCVARQYVVFHHAVAIESCNILKAFAE
jgi:hypothetical protein